MLKSNTRKYLWMTAGLSITASLALVGCNNGGSGGAAGGATSGGDTIAVVNGTNIGREDLRTYLEAKGGTQVLRQLIDFELVMQHAKTAGVEITDAELDAAIADQQKQNPQMAQTVKNGGAALETLRREMRYQLALDKLLTKDIKVDEAAQKKWFEKNRTRYDKPAQVQVGILFASTKQRADVMSQQLKKDKSFHDLVEEQKKANDDIAKASTANTSESPTPGMPAPEYLPISALPEALKQAAEKLKPGETSGVVELKGAQTAYAIMKLIKREDAVKAKADDPLPLLEYKLEQVARKAMTQLPVNPQTKKKPTFEEYSAQAQQYLQQQNMQQGRMEPPTQRDVLNLINQSEVQRILTEVRSKATVSSTDPVYTAVVKEYQPAPTPAAGAAGGAAAGAAPGAAPDGSTAGGVDGGGAPAAGNAAGAAPAAPAAP
ncbi:MAG: foldase protein PrsA [Abditibacteriota bacterium]|nr:foldase protein PrsA [Abditibacteriota bacterium]